MKRMALESVRENTHSPSISALLKLDRGKVTEWLNEERRLKKLLESRQDSLVVTLSENV
jgi:hypothetical protein